MRAWTRLLARVLGRTEPFPGSQSYWQQRYTAGGTSGRGSYGELAAYKAEFLNGFVREHNVRSIIEFGCGDGAQLSLAEYPRYIGLDVAKPAITLCAKSFEDDPSKSFFLYDSDAFVDRQHVFHADLALSLDVIYHLTEDAVFEAYMRHLFDSADRFVIAYSSNMETRSREPHIRHRKFTEWVSSRRSEWQLCNRAPNPYPVTPDGRSGSFADFFVFHREPE